MKGLGQFTQPEILEYEKLSTTEQFKKVLLTRSNSSESLSELLSNVYSRATQYEWDIIKKSALLNLTLKAVNKVVQSHSREQFLIWIQRQSELLGRRDGNFKILFSQIEIEQIKRVLTEAILPYFQMYRIIFDSHFHFRLETEQKQLVTTQIEGQLSTGTAIEVQSIPAFQQFLGIRQPKQQKKDAKKK